MAASEDDRIHLQEVTLVADIGKRYTGSRGARLMSLFTDARIGQSIIGNAKSCKVREKSVCGAAQKNIWRAPELRCDSVRVTLLLSRSHFY